MTGTAAVDWMIGIVVALAGAFGVWAGAKKSLADARALKAPPPTPYDSLANRVTTLEQSDAAKKITIDQQGDEIGALRAQVLRLAGVLTREVRAVLTWHDAGGPPPPPDREVAVIRSVINELNDDR